MLAATLHEAQRAEGGVHDGHGLELAGRQELFGGHDRRRLCARGGQPNRLAHCKLAPDGRREKSRRIVGPSSSVAGGARGVKRFEKALTKIARKSGPLQFAQRPVALPADGVGNQSRSGP